MWRSRKLLRNGYSDAEREKMERLEKAEGELNTLKSRAAKAVGRLDSRQQRNHWSESIETMIQGGI